MFFLDRLKNMLYTVKSVSFPNLKFLNLKEVRVNCYLTRQTDFLTLRYFGTIVEDVLIITDIFYIFYT